MIDVFEKHISSSADGYPQSDSTDLTRSTDRAVVSFSRQSLQLRRRRFNGRSNYRDLRLQGKTGKTKSFDMVDELVFKGESLMGWIHAQRKDC